MATLVKTKFDFTKIDKKQKKAVARALKRSGALVRTIARRSLKSRKKASSPGTPPTSRARLTDGLTAKGNPKKKAGALKNSILFAAGESSVIIGASKSLISNIGEAHERGGRIRTPNSGRTDNWKLELGGHGPIKIATSGRAADKRKRRGKAKRRKIVSGQPVIGKLDTQKRVNKARKLARIVRLKRRAKGVLGKRFPKRAFMRPALQTAIQSDIPKIFRESFNKSR